MRTHNQLVEKLMRRKGVRSEVERIEREEGVLLDVLLRARQQAGLSPRRSLLNAWERTPLPLPVSSARLRPARTRSPSLLCETTSMRVASAWFFA